MGLKHLPLVSIVLLFLSILVGINLGGQSLSERLRCLGFCLKERKMLTDFAMVIGVVSILGTWQNR